MMTIPNNENDSGSQTDTEKNNKLIDEKLEIEYLPKIEF